MGKIYLPDEINQSNCPTMVSSGTLRVYSTRPNGSTISNVTYTDFYIRDNYISQHGVTNFSPYTSINCIDTSNFTTEIWYRNDLADILIITSFFIILFMVLPFRLFSRFFGRWLKL